MPLFIISHPFPHFTHPFFRIPRYILLLKEFKKYAPAHADELATCMSAIESTLKTLNARIEKNSLEDARRLQNALETIDGEIEQAVGPTSVLVRQSTLNCRKFVESKSRCVNRSKVSYLTYAI